MKYCVDCKHYAPVDFLGDFFGTELWIPSTCNSPKVELDLVTKKAIFSDPNILRREAISFATCGKEGRWFEEKEKSAES